MDDKLGMLLRQSIYIYINLSNERQLAPINLSNERQLGVRCNSLHDHFFWIVTYPGFLFG